MSDPLALLPLALAAGGGRIAAVGAAPADDFEVQQLVAAGITLLQRSALLVRALSGRRSAILLPTSPAFLTALAASDGRGAVLINPLAATAEIAFQCANANVGAIFTTMAFIARLPRDLTVVLLDDAPRSARVIGDGRTQDVDLGSHHGLALHGERDVDGRDEEAAIVYTSAMHGTPLGAVLTHRNLLANARSTSEALENTSSDHVLALLPFAHLFGLTGTCSAPLLTGARITTMDRFMPLKAGELIANGGITQVIGVPAVFLALLSAMTRRGLDIRGSALRLAICGGAPLPRALQDRWADATGQELRQGYGLTEAGPVCLFNRGGRPNVRGTMGVAIPGVDVGIFTPADYSGEHDAPGATVALPDGTPGELCVRGANIFRGYIGEHAGLPMRGHWLCTGDECVRHPDGSVEFLGLIKTMFTRNGFNIYPRELERVVAAMPGVTRVSASAIPEPSRENDILLRVVGAVTVEDVRQWCEPRLSAYKQPSVIEITVA